MLPELCEQTVKLLKQLPKVGVAVSAGGDSVALLLAVQAVCDGGTTAVFVASVDHGLRKEAPQECEFVAKLCGQHNIPHTTLRWNGTNARGNLQAAARDARYRLLADWAKNHDIHHVLLGHTLDDQAETVLMAMGRGAGPEGLAGMPRETMKHGVLFVRPLLNTRRDALRVGLAELGQQWIDDPSNEDARYQRIRVRSTLDGLEAAGVGREAIAQVAENMRETADALRSETAEFAAEHVIHDHGDILLRKDVLGRLRHDAARRLVLAILSALNGTATTPRRAEQREALRRLRDGESATIAGCRLTYGWGMVRFSRELRAVLRKETPTNATWDGRWRFDGPHEADLYISALGDGINACPDWRKSGLPAASLRASPAIWRGKSLVAAPLARLYNGWAVQIVADLPTSGSGH